MKKLTFLITASLILIGASAMTNANENDKRVRYGTENVDGVDIFYRESGVRSKSKPSLVLLHGFPSSSHQYREVLAELGNEFHLIAPDYPGYGNSEFAKPSEYTYSFDNVANTIDKFLVNRGVDTYVFMIQDFGAPVGFRIATAHPQRLKGFVVMNGNAYQEGIKKQTWAPIIEYWENKTPEKEEQIKNTAFTLESMKWQYTHGTRDPKSINPDNWILDFYNFNRAGGKDMGIAMFYDYRKNLELYPVWQKYLRDNQPPMLIVWGKNDEYFPESGAEAYKKDVKNIDYNILDTGHFALEEEAAFIIEKMRNFMRRNFD